MSKALKSLCLAIVVALLGFVPNITVQASTNEPYGYQWKDDKNGMFHVQHYDFDGKANAYKIDDRMALKGAELYDQSGVLSMKDIANFSLKEPTVATNKAGMFFAISNGGEIRRLEESLSNAYQSVSSVTGKYFVLDNEDFAVKVMLSDGTVKSLSELVFSGSYSRHEDATVTTGSYVHQYAVGGNAEKIGYDAYFKNKLTATTECYNSSVYVKQFKKTLSKTCKGGKFVGYTAQYSVYVYDLSGKLYEFTYADGYSTAYEILNDEVVYSFDKNDNGFIKEIVTDKKRHPVSEVIKEPKKVSSKKVSKVKNFSNKSMAYNGKTLIGSLVAKNNCLYWKNKKLSKSIGAKDFGVSAKGSSVWFLPNQKGYYYDGKSVKSFASKVTAIKTDKAGRVNKYKANGKWKKFTKQFCYVVSIVAENLNESYQLLSS